METNQIIAILHYLNDIEETKGKKIKTFEVDETNKKIKIVFEDDSKGVYKIKGAK